MKLHASLLVVAFAGASFAANAQSLKPGLWEVANQVQAGPGPGAKDMARPQMDMANMSSEQRKAMQEMMAKHGVTMGSAGPGGMTVKVCMTREMVERNQVPAQPGDCKSTTGARTGNSVKVSFSCTNPPSSGEGTMTIASPEAYSMKMMVNTTAQGKPQKVTMDSSGKWVAADCGAVKPMATPKAAAKK